MGTPFINNKSDTKAVRDLMKPTTTNNRVIGSDPNKGLITTAREVNLPVRGSTPTK